MAARNRTERPRTGQDGQRGVKVWRGGLQRLALRHTAFCDVVGNRAVMRNVPRGATGEAPRWVAVFSPDFLRGAK